MLVNAARRTATSKSSSIICRRAASTIALKYSNALYSAALSKSPQTLTKVQSELAAISNGINTQKDLAAFLANPTSSVKERTEGLKAVFAVAEGGAGGGGKKEPLSEITKNFFGVLSENGRLGETQGAIEGFNDLVAKYKGEVEVVVTSATALDRSTLTRLESTLKQSQIGQKAKTLKVTNKVNPTILGGLIVDFGEKTIDLSVSSRVNKFNTLLQEGV